MVCVVVRNLTLCMAIAMAGVTVRAADGVVVIAHRDVPMLDSDSVNRIFTNRMFKVNGVVVTAVNTNRGDQVRARFLRTFLNRSDDDYTVRMLTLQSTGFGSPPKELPATAQVISFVNSTPGAIGYIDESDVRPGMNVVLRAVSR